MKRAIILLFIVFALLCSFIGCDSGNTENSQNGGNEPSVVISEGGNSGTFGVSFEELQPQK